MFRWCATAKTSICLPTPLSCSTVFCARSKIIPLKAQKMAGSTHSGFLQGDMFWLDSFALRQWDDPNYQGTQIDFDKAEFVNRVHTHYKSGAPLHDGYAPFCKHLFIENFVGARVGSMAITDSNRQWLRCGYEKRRPEELAVLSRWFPKEAVSPPVASFLDVILYSREQCVKEYASLQGAKDPPPLPNVPWGIISVKAQTENYEVPMQPITMMRNALGVEEGGSGIPVDRSKYEAAVAYWDTHASLG